MEIKKSSFEDIKEIFSLYKLAKNYQKEKWPENQWPVFEKSLIEKEIKEGRQWKLLIENKIACIWAITFNDPQIWEESHNDRAIYIHRIAKNPNFRGKNFVGLIVKWAKDYAKSKNKEFIRMDTVGNNQKLIDHYKNNGFEFLGLFRLNYTEGLPAHYQNAAVSLFEIRLK